MKININLLKKFVEIPLEINLLRQLLDDLGLEVKGIEGDILDIETLAHRGDHLSAIGIAREIAARNFSSINIPNYNSELPEKKTSVGVSVKTKNCYCYCLLEVILPEDYKFTPEVSLDDLEGEEIVRLVNYIQLELGQPMHAFDADLIKGQIKVEELEKSEDIIALDQKKYSVPEGSIVIKDQEKIIAVAGVIGCANSMVTKATKKIFVESASFDPVKVRIAAKKMGLSTDASYIFERGSDFKAARLALERFNALGINPFNSLRVIGFTAVENFPVIQEFKISDKLFELHSGTKKIDHDLLKKRLKILGYDIHHHEKTFTTVPPSWRYWNVLTPMTVVEDYLRVSSYNSVKYCLPKLEIEINKDDQEDNLLENMSDILIGNGFNEIITRAYYSSEQANIISKYLKEYKHIVLANSLDKGFSHLRISHLVHFADVVTKNAKYGVSSVKIFETAKVFFDQQIENKVMSFAVAGRVSDSDFREKAPTDTLLFLQNTIFTLLKKLNINFVPRKSEVGYLHPSKQIEIFHKKTKLGVLGEIHPSLRKDLDCPAFAYAELDMDLLEGLDDLKEVVEYSDLPFIKRDLTITLPSNALANDLREIITDMKIPDLRKIEFVDDFKKTEEDFRRFTIRIVFQGIEQTLLANQVDGYMERIIQELSSKNYLLI